jgi:hypothetical protein
VGGLGQHHHRPARASLGLFEGILIARGDDDRRGVLVNLKRPGADAGAAGLAGLVAVAGFVV